jgi:hypothetical protein
VFDDGACDCDGNINDCTGVCGGTSEEDCAGACNGSATEDCFGTCNGTAVVDCLGECGGTAAEDNCGTCDTDVSNDCVTDCAGIFPGQEGYGSELDNCGICDDDTSNDCQQDCNDVWGGDFLEDNCGGCDNNLENDCEQDCNGDWGGPDNIPENGDEAVYDNCNICDADPLNDCEQDCNGDWGGSAIIDECGICTGGFTGNSPCLQDCAGNWGGALTLDLCGICGGNNSTCKDCLGVPAGGAVEDDCEVCYLKVCYDDGGNFEALNNKNQSDCEAHPLMDACVDEDEDGEYKCNGGGSDGEYCESDDDCSAFEWVFFGLTDSDVLPGNWNESCSDCNGTINGSAFVDDCSVCVGGHTGEEACEQDCLGYWGGDAEIDLCDVCHDPLNNDAWNSTCDDICGIPNGDGTSRIPCIII